MKPSVNAENSAGSAAPIARKSANGRQWLAELVWKTTKASAVGLIVGWSSAGVFAAPPTAGDQIDYEASGFKLPRGAVLPNHWAGPTPSGPVAGGPAPHLAQYDPLGPPAAWMTPGAQPIATTLPSAPLGYGGGYGVAPVNYQNGMMAGGCDAMPGHDGGCYQSGACDGSCGGGLGGDRQFEGILPALMGDCGAGQCQQCGQYGDVYGGSGGDCCMCSGCLGSGGVIGKMCNGESAFGDGDLGLLASYLGGGMAGCLQSLGPYTEGGKCAQRWYDVSLEAMFLSQNLSGIPGGFAVGNFGVSPTNGVANNPALTLGQANDGELAFGGRASIAMIFGAGGNIEATYMGGHNWDSSATVERRDPNERLTSFVSGFGFTPINGFENTSVRQSIAQSAEFHSGEINYRRRTVGPYCRFQGSWLMGLRYLRYDNDFSYLTQGVLGTITQFQSNFEAANNHFGPQAGFDFWYNVAPGLQIGTELKGSVGQNDWDRSFVTGLGTGTPLTVEDGGRDTSLMGELTVTGLYRFSHSWTFRTSYHLIGIDNMVAPTLDADFLNSSVTALNNSTVGPSVGPALNQSSLTMQGFTLGLEYLW